MIIDIHTHTAHKSDDSLLGVDELIEQAKKVGLDGICLTDHDRFWDHDEIRLLSRAHGFLVIPGCEVTTEAGHLLTFGLTGYVFGMHAASFVRRLVDRAGGAAVVAHPYRRFYWKHAHTNGDSYNEMLDRACRNDVFRMVEAIDVLNGRGAEQENAFSSEIARRFDLKGVGASDAHKLEDIGTYATEFERRISGLEDFIAELRAGRFRPIALRKQAPASAKTEH
ncbi:MAG: PHP domain-containing protein [Chloroflexi bacterium]|nr:PHP domain-containing protein [Chloroflexota bacterium]